MHPILFKLPLPNYDLPYAWILFAIAAVSAVVAAVKMLGKTKDRGGAIIAGLIAGVAVAGRFGARIVAKGADPLSDTINLSKVPIYSYGVMLGLSLVVGWYLTLGLTAADARAIYGDKDEPTRELLEKYRETMANNYVVTAIAAVVGSRILYILTNLNEFDTFASMFAMRRGGLVAYGGFLGGLAGSFFFLRHHKISLLPWADVAVPSLASGLMITRIGCYLFGCDFGQPLKENAPAFLKKLGTFPHWAAGTLEHGDGAPAWVQHVKERGLSPTSTASLPVHPTQLYESLVGLGLLVLLLWARKKQKFRGQIFLLFFFAYGVCRYLLEVLRDDAERGSIPPSLPEHILIPLGLVALAIGWCIGFSKAIENVTLRRLTQVLSFVPAIALYLGLQPAPGTFGNPQQYSTSQFIGIASGVLASAAFAVLYKAAQAHPKQAMALALPGELYPATPAEAPAPAAEEDEEEEAPRRRPAKKTTKAKGKGKKTAKKAAPAPAPKASDDDGEEERAPRAAEAKAETPEAKPEPAAGEDTGDDEPVKAS